MFKDAVRSRITIHVISTEHGTKGPLMIGEPYDVAHSCRKTYGSPAFTNRMNIVKKSRIIAPRLFSGERRESIGHGLPPEIKAGIKAIAKRKNESVSWVLEQIIIRYFNLPKPQYIKRKTDE